MCNGVHSRPLLFLLQPQFHAYFTIQTIIYQCSLQTQPTQGDRHIHQQGGGGGGGRRCYRFLVPHICLPLYKYMTVYIDHYGGIIGQGNPLHDKLHHRKGQQGPQAGQWNPGRVLSQTPDCNLWVCRKMMNSTVPKQKVTYSSGCSRTQVIKYVCL